jgi:hypothetical protein
MILVAYLVPSVGTICPAHGIIIIIIATITLTKEIFKAPNAYLAHYKCHSQTFKLCCHITVNSDKATLSNTPTSLSINKTEKISQLMNISTPLDQNMRLTKTMTENI